MARSAQQLEMEARPVVTIESEDLTKEFLRHLQAAAKKNHQSPARYLLEPGHREELGLSVVESGRELSTHVGAELPMVADESPFRFVQGRVEGFEIKGQGDELPARGERIWSGWEVAGGTIPAPVMPSTGWEVEIEPIRVNMPKISEARPVLGSDRGFRPINTREVAALTGLTEVQFEIQPVLGSAHAITQGVLEAVPVVLPKYGTAVAWMTNDALYRDPMLLRFNRGKLVERMGDFGDVLAATVDQLNGFSGQAVHFAVQALAEAHMGAYLADKLVGRSSFIDNWLKERIKLLHSSARLAMTAYESLVAQTIAWSELGVYVLGPQEYAFAANATASFFDGVNEAGQFVSHDVARLGGVMDHLRSDLRSLGWKGR
jgi:hypothetical protein